MGATVSRIAPSDGTHSITDLEKRRGIVRDQGTQTCIYPGGSPLSNAPFQSASIIPPAPAPAPVSIVESVGLVANSAPRQRQVKKRARKHFRFLDLPTELRFMIYDIVLVVGKVFFRPQDPKQEEYENNNSGRYMDTHHFYCIPELQLLRVCKQIHKEAEPIYLAKNLFVLPIGWHHLDPFNNPYRKDRSSYFHRPLFSLKALDSIKNISIAIDMQDLARCGCSHWRWENAQADDFEDLTITERRSVAHRVSINQINQDDDGFGQLSKTLTKFGKYYVGRLEYLEIDFSNTFCPIGCCRPIGLMSLDWLRIVKPKKLTVFGLRSEQEEEAFFDYLKNFDRISPEMLYEQYGLELRDNCLGSKWEAWMRKTEREAGRNLEGGRLKRWNYYIDL